MLGLNYFSYIFRAILSVVCILLEIIPQTTEMLRFLKGYFMILPILAMWLSQSFQSNVEEQNRSPMYCLLLFQYFQIVLESRLFIAKTGYQEAFY